MAAKLRGHATLPGMGKPYRIIYSLDFTLEGGTSLIVPLDRLGQAAPRRSNDLKHGMPTRPSGEQSTCKLAIVR